MGVTLSNARSVVGLSTVASSDKPGVSYRETIGMAAKQILLDDATAAREIRVTFGSSGDSLAGNLGGAWTLTGSTTGTRASGTLTLSGNPTDGQTVTIGTKVYTFKTTLGATANQVLIGASASASLDNLIAAVNGGSGSGTLYSARTVAHTLVTAAAGAGDTMVVTAVAYSSSGNAIATTETLSSGSWGGSVLAGGVTPCVAEGADSLDITGDALATANSVDGFELRVHSGSITVYASTGKINSLGLTGPAVLHLSGTILSGLGTVTVTSGAPDTTVSVTALYH